MASPAAMLCFQVNAASIHGILLEVNASNAFNPKANSPMRCWPTWAMA